MQLQLHARPAALLITNLNLEKIFALEKICSGKLAIANLCGKLSLPTFYGEELSDANDRRLNSLPVA